MAPRKRPSRSAAAARAGGTPPSISDELMARSDRGKLFTDDGRKVRDTGRVGAMTPDTDPPDSGLPAHAASQGRGRSTP